jgi:hypothetical protein
MQPRGAKDSGIKGRVEFASIVLLPIIGLAFVLAEHSGLTDHILGLDLVEKVADRFDKSYAPNASMPVYPERMQSGSQLSG